MARDDEIQGLIDEGRLAEAAERLESDGLPQRAISLWEQLWDFSRAASAARAAGDLPRALENHARGKQLPEIEAVLNELRGAPHPTIEHAAEVCEERGLLAQAASLRRQLGHGDRASQLYQAAGLLAKAAEVHQEGGRYQRAMELYARIAEEGGDDHTSSVLALGVLLLRFGRFQEAIPRLQQAASKGCGEAALACAVALHRAGYPRAARITLELAKSGPTLEEALASAALAPFDGGDDSDTVIAGRYRLGELLGAGGMGRVYKAEDLLQQRHVAVKIFATPGGIQGRDAYQRFLKEAKVTGSLDHPHIVRLLDSDPELGFTVLEFMEGGTLAERLHPRLQPAQCRAIALQLLDGLSAAHQRAVVHRDLKPSNIFFTAAGAAKIGDFGVAHLQDSGKTQTGAFIGTLAYMAPEQIRGQSITFATDIYAFGVTLFRMLTGQLPFEPPDLVDKHLHHAPPTPSSIISGLPEVCDEVLLRCLHKIPTDRYPSLDALRLAVERFPAINTPMRKADSGEQADPAHSSAEIGEPQRYQTGGARLQHPKLQLFNAEDQQLSRTVVLVRITGEKLRESILRLLQAAATGGENLQRVLDVDPERGKAMLLDQAGAPLGLTTELETRLELCAALAKALRPLHDADLGHGAVALNALRSQAGAPSLSLIAALEDRLRRDEERLAEPTPSEDILALAQLLGLAFPEEITGASGLARWARGELKHVREMAIKAGQRHAMDELEHELPSEHQGLIRAARLEVDGS